MTSPYLLPALADRLEEMAARKDLEPVEVAVLDSGVDATHPDLAGRVVEAFKIEMEDDIPRVKEIPQGTNNDQFGHGTGVASIIARLAPNARLVDIRVLGADNRGAGAGLVAGLRVAVRRKSKIINMSLAASAGFSQKIMTLCEEAYHANTLSWPPNSTCLSRTMVFRPSFHPVSAWTTTPFPVPLSSTICRITSSNTRPTAMPCPWPPWAGATPQ